MNILDKIIRHKKQELKKHKRVSLKQLLRDLRIQGRRRSFKKAISKKDKLCIIAEIKKKSPSAGVLRKDFNPVRLAKGLERQGVDALSVLTDKKFFGGNISFIPKIRKKVRLPILRKDFIIDEYQVYESYICGADAILLITRILAPERLRKLYKLTRKLGMDCIVEVYSRQDLKKALRINPQIIGVNNRNLVNFKVDLRSTIRLLPLIPKGRVIVSESGIGAPFDLEPLKKTGINAVLIGQAFMQGKALVKQINKKGRIYRNSLKIKKFCS